MVYLRHTSPDIIHFLFIEQTKKLFSTALSSGNRLEITYYTINIIDTGYESFIQFHMIAAKCLRDISRL